MESEQPDLYLYIYCNKPTMSELNNPRSTYAFILDPKTDKCLHTLMDDQPIQIHIHLKGQ